MARVGTFGQMLEDEEHGVTDFTKNGECSGCGNCCANFLPVSDVEIKRIREYIKKHGITEHICRFPTAEPVIDMQCPFRDEIGRRCTIYPVRPAICRDFRCDKSEKEIKINKALYHGKYSVTDMRSVFFGRENRLVRIMKEIF